MSRVALSLLAAAALLAGCASPGSLPPQASPITPSAAGLADAPMPAVPEAWWRAFGDPALDALVERALADAPSLQAAQARVVRAAALAQGTAAAGEPQVGLGVDITRQRYTEHGLFPPPIAGGSYTSANAQLSLGWEFDLFGRQQAAVQAAVGAERAAQADVRVAAVVLASQVVRGHLALARLTGQRELQQRAIAQREEMLALTRRRVEAGLDTRAELRLSETSVPEAQQQLAALDEQAELLRHQLAVLTAQPPTALQGRAPLMPAHARLPRPQALGADLLGRRADIVAARWRVEATQADVAAARAQFMPNISLSAFVGLNSLGLDRWLDLGSRNVAAGPALRLPIFDAGRLRANLRAHAADVDAAVAAYNAAVLDAAREVADAIASLDSLQRQQALQAQSQQAAESAYDIALQRYRAGLGGYLLVLQAESGVLAQRRLGVDLRARVLDTQAQLMRALGGGIETGLPPTQAAAAP